MTAIRRERPSVKREVGTIATFEGEEPAAGPDPGPTVEGREPMERENGNGTTETHLIGTCRICQLGGVVLVRRDHSRRGEPDIRALCLYCHRDLDPHEVELG